MKCIWCQAAALRVCERCKCVVYCGERCRAEDWGLVHGKRGLGDVDSECDKMQSIMRKFALRQISCRRAAIAGLQAVAAAGIRARSLAGVDVPCCSMVLPQPGVAATCIFLCSRARGGAVGSSESAAEAEVEPDDALQPGAFADTPPSDGQDADAFRPDAAVVFAELDKAYAGLPEARLTGAGYVSNGNPIKKFEELEHTEFEADGFTKRKERIYPSAIGGPTRYVYKHFEERDRYQDVPLYRATSVVVPQALVMIGSSKDPPKGDFLSHANYVDYAYPVAAIPEQRWSGVDRFVACQGPMPGVRGLEPLMLAVATGAPIVITLGPWNPVTNHDYISAIGKGDDSYCSMKFSYADRSASDAAHHDIPPWLGTGMVDGVGITVLRAHLPLRNDVGGEPPSRHIVHVHFKDWADSKQPTRHSNPTDLISIIILLRAAESFAASRAKLDEYGASKDIGALYRIPSIDYYVGSTPRPLAVVHCSAGIGRTGTFISCAILSRLIGSLALGAIDINITDVVKTVRMQRAGAVQTPEQFEFIKRFAKFLTGFNFPGAYASCPIISKRHGLPAFVGAAPK